MCVQYSNIRQISQNKGEETIPLKLPVMKNKIDMATQWQWMENLPTEGNIRVEISLYISQYIRKYIWIFRCREQYSRKNKKKILRLQSS